MQILLLIVFFLFFFSFFYIDLFFLKNGLIAKKSCMVTLFMYNFSILIHNIFCSLLLVRWVWIPAISLRFGKIRQYWKLQLPLCTVFKYVCVLRFSIKDIIHLICLSFCFVFYDQIRNKRMILKSTTVNTVTLNDAFGQTSCGLVS